VVIALIALTVLLVIFATIQNRFGSFSSIIGAGAHIAEEAGTWTAPWTTV
jgi:serine/threonine-protein kinase